MRKTKSSILAMAMMLGVGLAGTTLSTTGSEAQGISCGVQYIIDQHNAVDIFDFHIARGKYDFCVFQGRSG